MFGSSQPSPFFFRSCLLLALISALFSDIAIAGELDHPDPPKSISTTDSLALVDLYWSLDGDNWNVPNPWLIGPLDTWFGVSVDSGRVVGIDLSMYFTGPSGNSQAAQLSGPLPNSIGNLQELREIKLHRTITGELPEEFYTLSRLREVLIWDSKISGSLSAAVENMIELRSFTIHSDSLNGEIPQEIGRLPNLERLRIRGNFEGQVPESIADLSKLTSLTIGGGNFNSEVPSWIGSISSLIRLELWGNNFTGNIPSELGNLSELHSLTISDVGITGPLPKELGNLRKLDWLRIHAPNLSSSIPPEWGGMQGLTWLDIPRADLWGPIPQTIGEIPNLVYLDLRSNSLSGFVPENLALKMAGKNCFLGGNSLRIPPTLAVRSLGFPTICRLSVSSSINQDYQVVAEEDSLALIDIFESNGGPNWTSHHWRIGPVVAWTGVRLDSLGKVISIDLANGELTGELSSKIGQLTSLIRLDLSGNQLTGSLPEQLGQLNKLRVLDLSQNQLEGQLEGLDFSQHDSLEELFLHYNSLSGNLPLGQNLPNSLRLLYLYENNFIGTIPPDYGSLNELRILALQSNNLSGTIPPELGALDRLHNMSLKENMLEGSIPSSFTKLESLIRLDLSMNQLSGTVPLEVASWLAESLFTHCKMNENSDTFCIPDTPNYQALGKSEICLLPLSSSCSPIDVGTENQELAFRNSLGPAFPNPAIDRFTIPYSLFSSRPVIVSIYNSLGQEIYHQDLGTKDPGTHKHILELPELSSGVYFYLIQAGDFRATNSLTIRNSR